MNQNLLPTYFQTGNLNGSIPQQLDHILLGDRVGLIKDDVKSAMQGQGPTGMTIHPNNFFQTTSGSQFAATNSSPAFHSPTTGAAFISNSVQNVQIQSNPPNTMNGQQTQQVRLVQTVNSSSTSNVTSPQQQAATVVTVVTAQNPNGTTMQILQPQGAEADERRIAAILDSYFIEQQAPTTSVVAPITPSVAVAASAPYPSPASIVAKYTRGKASQEKKEKDEAKRAKQAEAARLRYHRLSAEEKRALNIKRTMAQKRKRQREKELEELENLLRETNDIQEDPDINEQLREKRMRARWAEAARSRYQRMSSEERRAHNNRRRMRQIAATEGLKGPDGQPDEEAIKRHIKEQNAKKAEAARLRYHRMTEEEKRATEAFRRRRMEEEMLLAMPIGRINGEALDRAQQIVVRNAKRAEAARLRYQRMTPEQRKAYNQKRYTPRRKRLENADGDGSNISRGRKRDQEGQYDALSTLERDVIKRTQQAHQVLMRQRGSSVANTPTGTYLTAHVVPQPHSNVTTGLQNTMISNSNGTLPGVLPTQIQSPQIQAVSIQTQQQNQPIQQQSMSQIPQQIQVHQIHRQQIQNQASQQPSQQQIQYTVAPTGQMMVGHLQQQLLSPYATVPPRA
ncbi:unnamed protein product [Thelazia callipaeda]|uniref:Uncharacterized protein n=1 Tax=Thelazia callipaeda TaxID=103827 RepID=A0A0N5D1R5_THECL|nr:unnamed protein product [Thelazia callipaeda]